VIIPAADAVTHFQFGQGEVAVGDGIFANVDINGRHVDDGSTTNGPEKQPERLDVYLNCGSVGGSASSSASGSGSDSSSSSSSSRTSKICILVKC
jgi:hypothetical protein